MPERKYDTGKETIMDEVYTLTVDLTEDMDLKARKLKCWQALKKLPSSSWKTLMVKYRGGMMETVHCELCNKDIERVKADWEMKFEYPEDLIGAYQFELKYTLRQAWR